MHGRIREGQEISKGKLGRRHVGGTVVFFRLGTAFVGSLKLSRERLVMRREMSGIVVNWSAFPYAGWWKETWAYF